MRYGRESRARAIGIWLICVSASSLSASNVFLVKDICTEPQNFSSFPGQFVLHDGAAYFSAWTPTEGLELWRSDGTATGTQLVRDGNRLHNVGDYRRAERMEQRLRRLITLEATLVNQTGDVR